MQAYPARNFKLSDDSRQTPLVISPLPMLLDSIQGITKVNHGALFDLWTKYGKWDSEGPLLFEKREVVRQTGDQRASVDVNVPTSCYLLKLPEYYRQSHRFVVSDILIRDDYVRALNDICYFATHMALPPPQHGQSSSPGDFKNPFLNSVLSNVTAVSLLGHPGIGKQCEARRNCDSSSSLLDQGKAFGCTSFLHSVSSQDVLQSTTTNPKFVLSLTQMACMKYHLQN
jgi:hypothetical protein